MAAFVRPFGALGSVSSTTNEPVSSSFLPKLGWRCMERPAEPSNAQRQAEPVTAGPLKTEERWPHRRSLHPLHCLEDRGLRVPGPGRKHLGVDHSDGKHLLTRPDLKRPQSRCYLVPAARLGQFPTTEPKSNRRLQSDRGSYSEASPPAMKADTNQ